MAWFLVLTLTLACSWFWRRWYLTEQRELELRDRFSSLQQEKKIIFDFLHDLGDAFSEHMDPAQLLQIVLNCAEKVTESRGGIIYLWQPKLKKFQAQVVHGVFPPPFPVDESVADKIATRHEYLETFLKNELIGLDDDNIIAQVARENHYLWIPDASHDRRFPKFREESLQVKTFLAVPLFYQKERVGVIALANRHDGTPFRESDFEVLKSVGDQAAYAIHSAQLYSQLMEKRKMDHDLQVASEIQRILLPANPPNIPNFDLCATNLAALQVSGDYYDFIQVSDRYWGVAIADVSGKGIPASIIMAMCRSVLRSKAIGIASPAEVLRAVNRQLFPDIRKDMFITMIYAVVDTLTGEARFARAGHEAPLLCTSDFGTIEPSQAPGMALGIDDGEIFDQVIEDKIIPMKPGDTLVLYTDGLNEAIDESGEEFGRENLVAALKIAGNQGVDVLVKNIVERVQRFSSGHAQMDDITLAIIQRKSV